MRRFAWPNGENCPVGESMLDASHVARLDRDAASRGPQILVGQMKEDRAAPPDPSRLEIIPQYADHVVKMVFAPKRFGALPRGQPNRAIVVARSGIVAPSVKTGEAFRFGQASAPTVDSSEPSHDCKTPCWGHAVAFEALDADAAATDGAFDNVCAEAQQTRWAPLRLPRPLVNKNIGYFPWGIGAAPQKAILTRRT